MAIQPKNTGDIKVNTITEKTALSGVSIGSATIPLKVDLLNEITGGAGIKLGHTAKVDAIEEKTAAAGLLLGTIIKLVSGATKQIVPQAADVDLGTSTAAQHIAVAFIKAIKSTSQAMALLVTTAHSLTFGTNSIVRLTLDSAGKLIKRLGHTGYTSGGEIEEFSAAVDSTSTSPVTIFTQTIPANTQVMMRIQLLTRDNSTAAQSFLESACDASRAGAGAVAGTVTTLHTVGVALQTITMNATGNTIEVRVQNVSGTNTRSGVAKVEVIGVSTAT